MTGISVLGTIRMVFFFAAYYYTSIGNAVIIFYTFPIFVALFGFWIIKEQVTQRQILLMVIAFAGIILVFSNKEFSFKSLDFIGMLASLLSAIIYALTVVLFKSETKNYSWKELIFYQNFMGLFLLLPFFQLSKATTMDYTLGLSYATLIGLGVFGLFFFGLRRLKASVASALMYMEVVSAIVLSYLFMGEILTWPMLVGASMIIGSSVLLKN